jgi:hypothetical protein
VSGPEVVWYGDDSESLIHRVVPFIASAVQDHGAALVIASAEHERAFRAALEELGVDIHSAAMRDRLVFLNANEVIKGLFVDGEIDRARYVRLVVNPIRKLGERYTVHAYGEVAGILGSMGRLDAVARLQGLARELLRDVPVRLVAGYPAHAFEQELNSA